MLQRFYVSFFIGLLTFGSFNPSSYAEAGGKIALIVGNGAYRNAPALENPTRDARDMAASFKRLGFKVHLFENLNRLQMQKVLRDVVAEMAGARVGAFFFAGHAVQIRGRNYLLPVDSPELSIDYLDRLKALRLDIIIRLFEENTATRLLFVDACRDNPLGRSLKQRAGARSAKSAKGLAMIGDNEISTGTLISFATAPGKVASDGVGGRNSPYTAALKTAILTPNKDLGLILRSVRSSVRRATLNEQVPWYNVGLEGSIVLNPVASAQEGTATKSALTGAASQSGNTSSTKSGSNIGRLITSLAAQFRSPSIICARGRQGGQCIKPGRAVIVRDERSNGEDCPECPALVAVPTGTFTPAGATGAVARRGRRKITRPFLIARHEVSFAEWQACVAAGGCNGHEPNDNGWGRGSQPVIGVSFKDAMSYVRWLSKHTGAKYIIPTEAQWSYAARAGVESLWWWGNTPSESKANFDASQLEGVDKRFRFRRRTVAVDAFAANAWGIKNVHGNVAEWTSSCFMKRVDPSQSTNEALQRAKVVGADCGTRVTRGGAWDSYPRDTASDRRQSEPVAKRSDRLGFRVIRLLD